MPQLMALVGMKFRNTEDLVRSLRAHEEVMLKREPTNKFDPSAIAVYARGTHVGYLARKQYGDLPARMDRMGRLELRARIALQPDSWPLVEVDN